MRQTDLTERSAMCRASLRNIAPLSLEGRVIGLSGLVVDIDGFGGHAAVGNRLTLAARDGRQVAAEVVGFRQGVTQAMPYAALDGLGPGSIARLRGQAHPGRAIAFNEGGTLAVADAWLGRVLDPLGRALD